MTNENGYNKTAVLSALAQTVTLTEWAKTNNYDAKHVRRLARNGDLPSAFQFGKRWYMPKNANDVVPESKSRGTSRDDGRLRYTVYANDAEHANIIKLVGSGNVIDPRELARAKRAARKLANASETRDANDTAELNAARERASDASA